MVKFRLLSAIFGIVAIAGLAMSTTPASAGEWDAGYGGGYYTSGYTYGGGYYARPRSYSYSSCCYRRTVTYRKVYSNNYWRQPSYHSSYDNNYNGYRPTYYDGYRPAYYDGYRSSYYNGYGPSYASGNYYRGEYCSRRSVRVYDPYGGWRWASVTRC